MLQMDKNPSIGQPLTSSAPSCSVSSSAHQHPPPSVLSADPPPLFSMSSLTSSNFQFWRHLYFSKPRIRSDGVYISTITYYRSVQNHGNIADIGENGKKINQKLKKSVVSITYYRYLLFKENSDKVLILRTSEDKKKAVKALKSFSVDDEEKLKNLIQIGHYYFSDGIADIWYFDPPNYPKYQNNIQLELGNASGGRFHGRLAWKRFTTTSLSDPDASAIDLKKTMVNNETEETDVHFRSFYFYRIKEYENFL
eukprot:GHVL01023682.1.p1 GENE.GHVL01023682.1~~GHVL01023682.1.p1  ORF type:complete len:253 (+),score=45.47 GHVL01023682.1:211-969(+)